MRFLFSIVFTVVLVSGVAIAAIPPRTRAGPSFDTRSVRRQGVRFVGAAASASIVILVSGWVVPGLVVGAGAWWSVRGWQGRAGRPDAEIVRLDALASWIENVRDVLMAGEQPVGAITSSVGAAAPAIRPHVRRLAAGLGRQDPDLVFRRFADDLDDPLADLVAAGLAIAIRRGARTVPVLTALAEQTRQQVERRRLIEAERTPTRREVQALTLIMSGLLMGLLVFGRSRYLNAYDRPSGQVFLGVALAGYAGLIARVQGLAAFPRPGRFLTGRTMPGHPRGTAR